MLPPFPLHFVMLRFSLWHALALLCSGGLLVGCTSDAAAPPQPSTARPSSVRTPASPSASQPAASPSTLAGRIEDARVEARVTQALVRHDRLRLFDFVPAARGGHVVLSGDVNTRTQHRIALETVQTVDGVVTVDDRMTVNGEAVASSSSPSSPSVSQPASELRGVFHTVQRGETLWQIAQQYQASVERIKAMNDVRSSSLEVGQRIRVR